VRRVSVGLISFLFLGSLLLAAGGSQKGAKPANLCVTCHRTAGGVPYLQHTYSDWGQSPHARAGVTCEACHGGDPAQKETAAAHEGMLPSTNERSRVYYTRLPASCGECHKPEFAAFKKSAHYRELRTSGKGPNCITCHGSMANAVPTPQELETTCTLCHRRPTQAYATLLSLNNAGAALRRLEAGLAQARAALTNVGPQEAEYQQALLLHQNALQDWHTFLMPEVLRASQKVVKTAASAENELILKGPQQHGPSKR
jgi:hypothetical protein